MFEYWLILAQINGWTFTQINPDTQPTSKLSFLDTFMYNILKIWEHVDMILYHISNMFIVVIGVAFPVAVALS